METCGVGFTLIVNYIVRQLVYTLKNGEVAAPFAKLVLPALLTYNMQRENVIAPTMYRMRANDNRSRYILLKL